MMERYYSGPTFTIESEFCKIHSKLSSLDDSYYFPKGRKKVVKNRDNVKAARKQRRKKKGR